MVFGTWQMELQMKAICEGRSTKHQVVQQSLEQYREVFVRTKQHMGVLKGVSNLWSHCSASPKYIDPFLSPAWTMLMYLCIIGRLLTSTFSASTRAEMRCYVCINAKTGLSCNWIHRLQETRTVLTYHG